MTVSRDPFANRRPPRSRWEPGEKTELHDLLAEGYGVINAARLFCRRHPDRTLRGAISQAGELLGYRNSRRPGRPAVRVRSIRVRSQNEVAALMGVDPKTVGHWTARGWLPTARTRRPRTAGTGKGGPTILIHDSDLMALLENHDAWPAVDVERITDPELRAAALELREQADGHWVAAADVVRAEGYTPPQVSKFVTQYPGPLTRTTWKRMHYVWSADVPAWVAWIRHPRPRPTRKDGMQ